MATLIRNKLIIIPNAQSEEEYNKQIKDVAVYCSAMEDGVRKNICFTKITPKPTDFEPGTKEEDDWLLRNWGTRFKALNACWISDDEMIFDTFCRPAIPIAYKIMKEFKDIDFSLKYASSKTGTTTGEIYTSDENFYSVKAKDYSKTAYEIAFELRPHLRDLYTLNMTTNTYDYDTSDIRAAIEQNGFYKGFDGTFIIGLDDKNKPLVDVNNNPDDLPF
jgi:hypothetical protein